MNIEANPKITSKTMNSSSTNSTRVKTEDSPKFAEELTNLSSKEESNAVSKEETKVAQEEETKKQEDIEKADNKKTVEDKGSETKPEEDIESVIDGLKNTVEEVVKVKNPDDIIQTEENVNFPLKDKLPPADKNKNDEDNLLINNDMNIQEPKEQLNPQMNANMNFNSNGQPFQAFVNNQNQQELALSETDLAEESAILSSMSENLAIARKNMLLNKKSDSNIKNDYNLKNEYNNSENKPDVKTVTNNQGVKKVDAKTNITVETVVKYDTILMNEGDVEFFTKLVENGSVDMNSTVHQASKSAHVSKTLADMLVKSMNDNQPVRIDFDNNISVIIKIGKDGKISADFLPSSQVAEAYLKENLPLLRQRFDDNNIEYDELNQRKQQQDDRNNRKKGRKDE